MINRNFDTELRDKAIVRAGLLLYHFDEAISLLALCRKHGIQVLGIDSFDISNDHTRPVMEHSIDFSSESLIRHEDAVSYLESKRGLGLVFEIIY